MLRKLMVHAALAVAAVNALSVRSPSPGQDLAHPHSESQALQARTKGQFKAGSIYVPNPAYDPHDPERSKLPKELRLRAGMIAYKESGQVVMVNTGNNDWIFPRGGLDSRVDEYDATNPGPAFRTAAEREAREEAGVYVDLEPEDYYFLADDVSTRFYAAPLSYLAPEHEIYENVRNNRGFKTRLSYLSEAWDAIFERNGKKDPMMKKALKEAMDMGYIRDP